MVSIKLASQINGTNVLLAAFFRCLKREYRSCGTHVTHLFHIYICRSLLGHVLTDDGDGRKPPNVALSKISKGNRNL